MRIVWIIANNVLMVLLVIYVLKDITSIIRCVLRVLRLTAWHALLLVILPNVRTVPLEHIYRHQLQHARVVVLDVKHVLVLIFV